MRVRIRLKCLKIKKNEEKAYKIKKMRLNKKQKIGILERENKKRGANSEKES